MVHLLDRGTASLILQFMGRSADIISLKLLIERVTEGIP